MHQLVFPPDLLTNLRGQTVIVTGSARGIGASTGSIFNANGANVVIVDLPTLRESAETLIKSFENPERGLFVPASITEWKDLVKVFKTAVNKFGRVDIVIANAGTMESAPVLDVTVDNTGDPIESIEANRVMDVNLKGTMNTLRLGLHYLGQNSLSPSGWRGSIVLIASTSGYFGSTGNAAYIASKHGVVGLFRAALSKTASLNVRLNAIAPGYTPTHITAGFGNSVFDAKLEANTPENVGLAIAYAAADESRHGTSCLVLGRFYRELERTQQETITDWLGSDLVESLAQFGDLIGRVGYPLPRSSL